MRYLPTVVLLEVIRKRNEPDGGSHSLGADRNLFSVSYHGDNLGISTKEIDRSRLTRFVSFSLLYLLPFKISRMHQ